MESLPQQPTSSLPLPATNTVSASKKSSFLILITFLLACSTSGLIGYWFGQRTADSSSNNVHLLPTPQPFRDYSASPSPSEVFEPSPSSASISTQPQSSTENWLTYTDPKFGFSFQYPPYATTGPRDPDPLPVAIQVDHLIPRTGGGGGPEMVGWLMIISEPQPNPQKLSLRAWAQQPNPVNPEGSTLLREDATITDFKIGTYKAIRWNHEVPYGFKNYLIEKSPTEVVYITVNHGGLSENLESDIFDQMLSTWKF